MLPLAARCCPSGIQWEEGGYFLDYLHRIFSRNQMDFEYAFAQMTYLCVSPRRVARWAQYRKQTKNRFARDDPSFTLLLLIFLIGSGLAYGVAFGSKGWSLVLSCALPPVSFLGFGVLVSSATYIVAEHFLRSTDASEVWQDSQRREEEMKGQIEWAYCFDVHCNAAFASFIISWVLQYLLLPIIIKDTFVPAVVANSLHFASVVFYCYVTTLGFNVIPCISNAEVFLTYPVFAAAVVLLFLTFFHCNVARWTVFMLVSSK
eukprot:GHVU01233310.1.p1 GENE.GHVU01233310.1~~GHVU01233310.1.p1  ORF type:complete len:261 (+),score=22.51 GHVU01233310.1:137-919(+)